MKNLNFKILERYIYMLVLLLNLIPLLVVQFFPTVDGPAHLYNANIINSLLFENHSNINTFFSFNAEPVPNWTGHAILAFFSLFLPSFLAEKALLLIYMIGLPLAFRGLIRTVAPERIWWSYFIFPFTYSLVFFFGFYNFSFSLIFLLLTLNFWIKQEHYSFSFKFLMSLFFLIAATYFSHIFVFGILLFLLGLHVAIQAVFSWLESKESLKSVFQNASKRAAILLISSVLPLVLFAQYFLSRPHLGQDVYLQTSELVDWLRNMRPIIALHFNHEEPYTTTIAYVLLALTCVAIFNSANNIFKQLTSSKTDFKNWFLSNAKVPVFWLMAALLMLFFYFKFPDSDGYAGFITIRLGMLFFLFYVLWLASQKISVWIGFLSVLIVLFCNFKLNSFYLEETKRHNEVAQDIYRAASFIETNSIVLPIDYSADWFDIHFSNYMGIDKPMVILENYECNHGYFPLVWNETLMPSTLLGNLSKTDLPCVHLKQNLKNNTDAVSVDYVLILGDLGTSTETCHQKIEAVLNDQFTEIYGTSNCKLFRFNREILP